MCSSSRKIRLNNNSAKEHGGGGGCCRSNHLKFSYFSTYKTNSILHDETGNFSFDDRELEDKIRCQIK